jgi:hypothetical protein
MPRGTRRFALKRVSFAAVVGLSLLTVALPVAAAKPKVIGPSEEPRGYSLAEAAVATAYFNVGPRDSTTLDVLPAAFKGRPFQMLYLPGDGSSDSATFDVRTGTTLYVPLVYYVDTEAGFPSIGDPTAVADIFFGPGVTRSLTIDGVTTPIGREYAVGVRTPGLAGGTFDVYAVVAAFVAPLAPGSHQVVIERIGERQFSYTVNVR